jgi:hypothetical protein
MFFLYCQAERAKTESKISAKDLGASWKSLSAKGKEEYQEEFQANLEQWKKRFEVWQAKYGGDEEPKASKSRARKSKRKEEDEEQDEKPKKKKGKKTNHQSKKAGESVAKEVKKGKGKK